MAIPGLAVPGSVVASGSAVSPAGAQGIQGPTGTGGGGAGTKTWRKWNANDAVPPATLYGVWGVRNANPILSFNDTTVWSSLFIDAVPEGSVLTSGVLIRLFWLAATATTGAVQWGVQIDAMGAGTNPTTDSFDTAVTAFTTTNASNGLVTLTSLTLTTIDSIAIGDPYRLKVYRDAASGNDSMVGDAQLIFVEIRSAN